MTPRVLLSVLSMLLFQDDALRQRRALVQQLGSESVEDREDAEQKLIRIGKPALPLLEDAARSADRELAERARYVQTLVQLREVLSPGLLSRLPGIDVRAAKGQASQVLLESIQTPGVRRSDWEPLVPYALRNASPEEKVKICVAAEESRSRESARHIAPLLRDADAEVRKAAVNALAALGVALEGLADRDPALRLTAAELAALYEPSKAIPVLTALLEAPDSTIRFRAIGLLASLDAKSASPSIATRLTDGDARVRWKAVEALAALGVDDAIPQIGALLRDADPRMRAEAAEALGKLNARSWAQELMRLLKDPDGKVGDAAARALAVLQADGIVPAVIRMTRDDGFCGNVALDRLGYPLARLRVKEIVALLRDPEPHVRLSALASLLFLEAKDVMPEVVGRLADDDGRIRCLATIMMPSLGDKRLVPLVVPLLQHEKAGIRVSAIEALQRLGAEGIPPRLLEDRDPGVRRAAAFALAGEGSKEALPELMKAIDDPDEDTQKRAVDGLGRLEASEAIPRVAAMLDGNATLRRAALEFMSQLKARQCLPRIEALVSEGNDDALRALRGIAPEAARKQLVAMLESDDEKLRLFAVSALSDEKEDAALSPVLRLSDDSSPEIRMKVAWKLAEMKWEEAESRFVRLLADADPKIRVHVVGVINDHRLVAAAPHVLALIKDSDSGVRRAAVYALRSLGAREAIPRLRESLRDEDDAVRRAAVEALGELKVADAAPEIAKLVEDVSPTVRAEALSALADLGSRQFIPTFIAALDDEDSWVRRSAADALADLNARESIPQLEALLAHELRIDRRSRHSWAMSDAEPLLVDSKPVEHISLARDLCRLGSRAGVPCLLEGESGRLYVLNALRHGDVWRRLERLRLEVGKDGENYGELHAKVALAIGLPVELPEKSDQARIFVSDPYTIVDLLHSSLDRADPLDVIVEPDRLRIVTVEESRRFWRRWWAEERK